MNIDLNVALDEIRKDLEQNFPEEEFEYEKYDERITVSATFPLEEDGDKDVYIVIFYALGGNLIARALFSSVDRTIEVYEIINELNFEFDNFKAYIDEDSVKIERVLECKSIDDCSNFASSFIEDLLSMMDDYTLIDDIIALMN